MSRIGKRPVPVPKGVQANVNGQTVSVRGPKGELSATLSDALEISLGDGGVAVQPRNELKQTRALWGMSRTMVQNMMVGVTEGYRKALEVHGTGFRAAMKGTDVQMQVGLSHDVVHKVPAGIKVELPKPTEIVVTGIDKQKVGQLAAELRRYRPPEPYQGKGVRYQGEFIQRKAGKKK